MVIDAENLINSGTASDGSPPNGAASFDSDDSDGLPSEIEADDNQ